MLRSEIRVAVLIEPPPLIFEKEEVSAGVG